MPGVDVEVDAAQRVHAPKSNFSFRYLQKRHRSPPLRSGRCPGPASSLDLTFPGRTRYFPFAK